MDAIWKVAAGLLVSSVLSVNAVQSAYAHIALANPGIRRLRLPIEAPKILSSSLSKSRRAAPIQTVGRIVKVVSLVAAKPTVDPISDTRVAVPAGTDAETDTWGAQARNCQATAIRFYEDDGRYSFDGTSGVRFLGDGVINRVLRGSDDIVLTGTMPVDATMTACPNRLDPGRYKVRSVVLDTDASGMWRREYRVYLTKG